MTSPSDAPAASPRRQYRDRAARSAAERDRLAGVSGRLSHLRTAAFLLLIVAGLFVERRPGVPATVVAVVVFVTFIALIVTHNRVRRRERWNGQLVAYNEEGQHRLDRAWDRLPQHTPARDIAGHEYAGDLDLFGRASLTQILGPVGSAHGIATLDEWLLGRAAPAEILDRQAAVRELARLPDLREALALNARRTREVRQAHIERFLTWAEGGPWLRRVQLLRVASFLLPLATWVLLGLWVVGVVEAALWLIPVLAAAATFYLATVVRIRRTLDQAFGRDGMLAHYPELLAIVTHATFDAPMLLRIRQRLEQEGEPADHQLARLRRLMHLADVRLSMIHFPLYLVTMWDVHVLAALEKWQAVSGSAVRDWLRAIGELEALAALATLAHDQPDWCFPELLPHGAPTFDAQSLGHPLLADGDRVCNDVQIGPPGTFLLVTGSNMSGKSTLLRAVGLNAVLAQAGAPCCARTLSMAPLDVHTSIRVQDSLARGVSYFMAELERLKQVVDAAHHSRDAGEARLLFLLDEILHGTNTAERRIAARRVIRHLVDAGAVGAATTHDLDLATEPALTDASRLVHFREHFEDVDGRSTLRFDYRLREGLATSTNALELMRLVGLPADDDS